MMEIHMLFSTVGKIKKIILFPLIVILTGCSLFNWGLKLDIKPLNIPPHVGYILSKSSGYITVIDTKGDSVIGKEEVARRDNTKFEDAYDFLEYKGLLYITIYDKEMSKQGSDVLRIVDPAAGKVEESRVGWAPENIFFIGNNLALITSALIYSSNDSCYNYIYNLDTKKVVDTAAFKDAVIDFAVANGDTVIMDVKSFFSNGITESFALYSKRRKKVFAEGIPTYSIYAYRSHCALIYKDKLYVGGSSRIAVFSLSGLSEIKNIYLPVIGQHGAIISNLTLAHDKLYVSYLMDFSINGKSRIDIIDVNTDKLIKSIDILTDGAECIGYSASVDRLFAPSYRKGNVYVINPSFDSIVDTIKTNDTTTTFGAIQTP